MSGKCLYSDLIGTPVTSPPGSGLWACRTDGGRGVNWDPDSTLTTSNTTDATGRTPLPGRVRWGRGWSCESGAPSPVGHWGRSISTGTPDVQGWVADGPGNVFPNPPTEDGLPPQEDRERRSGSRVPGFTFTRISCQFSSLYPTWVPCPHHRGRVCPGHEYLCRCRRTGPGWESDVVP